jgi:hypothetical protein
MCGAFSKVEWLRMGFGDPVFSRCKIINVSFVSKRANEKGKRTSDESALRAVDDLSPMAIRHATHVDILHHLFLQ